MATIYGKGKGRSRSKKPEEKKVPLWVKYSGEEVEALVLKLAKKEANPTKIGQELRDTYGIPSVNVICKKSILQILKEKNLAKQIPTDLQNLLDRAVKLRKHYNKNKHDKTAKRGLQLTESRIYRLSNYYKKRNVLPKSWKYSENK